MPSPILTSRGLAGTALAIAATSVLAWNAVAGPTGSRTTSAQSKKGSTAMSHNDSPTTASAGSLPKTDAEWKAQLSPEQYRVLREHGTERAGTGEYANDHAAGTYKCAGCGQELFKSDAKFESGTGWPSFYQPAAAAAVETTTDRTFGMARTEVHCSNCQGHLGHVFEDGPKPTGLRYCINSVSLKKDAGK